MAFLWHSYFNLPSVFRVFFSANDGSLKGKVNCVCPERINNKRFLLQEKQKVRDLDSLGSNFIVAQGQTTHLVSTT